MPSRYFASAPPSNSLGHLEGPSTSIGCFPTWERMGLLESGRVRRLWVFDYPRNHAYPWFIELLPNIASKVSRINDARRVASHRYAKFFPSPPSRSRSRNESFFIVEQRVFLFFYLFFFACLFIYLFVYLFTYFLVGIFLERIEKFSLFEKNLTETSHSDERKNKKKERKLFVRPSFFHYFHFRTIASIGAGFSIRGEKRERGNGKERESEKWSKEVFLRIAPPRPFLLSRFFPSDKLNSL